MKFHTCFFFIVVLGLVPPPKVSQWWWGFCRIVGQHPSGQRVGKVVKPISSLLVNWDFLLSLFKDGTWELESNWTTNAWQKWKLWTIHAQLLRHNGLKSPSKGKRRNYPLWAYLSSMQHRTWPLIRFVAISSQRISSRLTLCPHLLTAIASRRLPLVWDTFDFNFKRIVWNSNMLHPMVD